MAPWYLSLMNFLISGEFNASANILIAASSLLSALTASILA